MRHPLWIVDAFTNAVFGGNPAAVVLLDEPIDDRVMKNIAAENNLSETAFVLESGDAFALRWFSPTQEVDFCGHATLAAAHVLRTERNISGRLSFATRAGMLVVEPLATNRYRLDIPRMNGRELAVVPENLQSVHESPISMFMNEENYFVEFPSEREVRAYVPDLAALADLHPYGLAITSASDRVDFVSRYFAPSYGIPEDPVTGSTHATLVPYWAKRFGKERLIAEQCSRRGGKLECTLMPERVLLDGSAATYLSGFIQI